MNNPPVGECEAADQPRLPRSASDGLAVGTFEAEAGGERLSGTAAFRVDTTLLGDGGRRVAGVIEMEASDGGPRFQLISADLLTLVEGETVRVAVRYDGFTGSGDLRVEGASEVGVAGAFAACTSHYPMGALWVRQARVVGGFRATRL